MLDRPPEGWQVQVKPPVMTRRFQFEDYAATRRFLDRLAALSEQIGYYPDLNFARTHVNVSVAASEQTLGPNEFSFAGAVDALVDSAAA